jgi:AAA+ ATPase superfamily predicted ATPase
MFYANFDFYAREEELKELNGLYKKSGFKFVVVYGRRRVGKSTVIQKFIDEDKKPNISFMALEQNDKLNLEAFSEAVLSRYGAAKKYLSLFDSWDKAFEYIASQAGNRKLVLFIDEYPYLANANKAISSILQKYADNIFRATNITLILCGSSMSFMENQVLGGKSPLYGRRDIQFKIEPFDYYESASFFASYSNEDKAVAYGVTGGIPLYLYRLKTNGSIEKGIKNEFLKKNGTLYEEPRNLLMQELREPAVYNAIIKSIANGATKLNDIAAMSGEDSKKVSKYLTRLISLHLVKKELPLMNTQERKSLYRLLDNMFRFWYRFVINNSMNIESGMFDHVYNEKILPWLSEYMGHIFEDICIQYMKRQNRARALPLVFDNIGRWWGNNPLERKQEEIDIIALSGKTAIFGECKWKNLVNVDILNSLKRKAEMFRQFEKKYYYIFSKGGFSESLQAMAAQDTHIRLISLDDIYK